MCFDSIMRCCVLEYRHYCFWMCYCCLNITISHTSCFDMHRRRSKGDARIKALCVGYWSFRCQNGAKKKGFREEIMFIKSYKTLHRPLAQLLSSHAIGAGGLRFKSRADQIGTVSPPLRCSFGTV